MFGGFSLCRLSPGLGFADFLLHQFAFADHLRCDPQDLGLAFQRRADDELHKALMTYWVVHQAEIRRAGVSRGIEYAAVRVDLEHVELAVCTQTEIAARIAVAFERLKNFHRIFPQAFFVIGIGGNSHTHFIVINPFQVIMFE